MQDRTTTMSRASSESSMRSRASTPSHEHQTNVHDPHNILSYQFDECFAWGMNNLQLGTQQDINQDSLINVVSVPTRINNEQFLSSNEQIGFVASGGSHTVIITTNHRVLSFGKNQNGQLGHGNFEDSSSPKEVQFDLMDDVIVYSACGDRHTVFLSNKGRVYVCGANFNYQLGLGHMSNVSSPTLVEQMMSRKIRRASCGARHTVLITGKGKIFTAGLGAFGQLGHGDFEDQPYFRHVEDIDWLCSSCSSKEHVNVALSSNYEVYQWGGRSVDSESEQIKDCVPTLLFSSLNGRRIVQIAASTYHALARTSDGSVYCWGYNLDNAGYMRLLKHIEMSDENLLHKPFLVESEKQLSEKCLDLSPKYIIRKNDLTVYRNHFFSNNKIVWIACSETCNYVVTEKGDVYVFGKGSYGESGLGDDRTSYIDYPEKIAVLQGKKVVRVVASTHSAFALTSDNSMQQQDDNLFFEMKLEQKPQENQK
ncbi:hypothetical protein C9374_009610 [Naegleria lovaniensis]|uniref:Regulator of chromosome condensation n=1 Tax=Naegleria lovaniensis TaxID=51637 RepID=A0AA88GXV8_NAELO|nr:uncharacterized protein C9374_009610 [Naegleria lovaniensis]KAG2393033.1 hypothetical protein C9374_009610 [Naegleria lovaniensis]